ncbi:MAG TPA: endonuclease V, partial [Candidatus Bathyarchaeota archaeon]|nr:endonuclease V [Candidatus Bathyarchaeota archaeon]
MKRFSVQKARKIQRELAKKIVFDDRFQAENIRFVAGVDVAYVGDVAIGAAAVLEYDSLETVEYAVVRCRTMFPYVPTLLSFREISPAVSCLKRLKIEPDVVLVDGHGYAHPFRCGFASHLGVVIGKPTVGVAKKLLCGSVGEFNDEGCALIVHEGEVVGMAVITKPGTKPVYVSVGNMVSLDTA